MIQRPTVLVDMDGVLADFEEATNNYLAVHHSTIPLVTNRQNFYFRDDYPDPEHQAIIKDFHHSQYFFANLPPTPGALEGWQRLIELGYEPRVCSAPLLTNRWCIDEKLGWIKKHLGPEAANTAIIDGEKEKYHGIALIDDRPTIHNAHLAPWRHILFTAKYNLHIDTEHRLNGWNDENLKQILVGVVRS